MVVRFLRNVSGNIAITSTLALVPIAGAAGVAVDMSRTRDLVENLQASLDAAVLAGAASENAKIETAEKLFYQNAVLNGATLSKLKFTAQGKKTVRGELTGTLPPSLTSALGFQTIALSLNATAASAVKDAGLCIMALAPSASQSLLVNSGANVNGPDCEIDIKSTASPAAIFNASTTITAAKICIGGSTIIDNGGSHANLQTGCTTLSDPYAGKIFSPASSACTFNNMNYVGSVILNPGTYCGWTNFNAGANVTLNPGTYIIKSGGWNVNGGTWTGTDVTFYYADTSKIQFNSAVKASLKAPTSGQFKDIFMAEASGLAKSPFVLDDSNGFDMTGIIYLPSRDVTINSGTSIRSRKITAVMNTLILNGVRWDLTPYDDSLGSGNAEVRLTE